MNYIPFKWIFFLHILDIVDLACKIETYQETRFYVFIVVVISKVELALGKIL